MNEAFARPTTLYLGGNRAVTKSKYGTKIFFDTRDLSVGINLALDGDYEPGLSPWMIGTLRTGDVAIEVGANIGFYALHFAQRVGPNGHVHAFECNPDLLGLLRDSVEINYLHERCTIHTEAVTDYVGEVQFHQPAKHLGSGTLIGGGLENDTWTSRTVTTTTLDAEFTGGESAVRLLHIDAEASEPKIIAGARKFIERHREMIVVLEVVGQAFKQRGDESIRTCLEYLASTDRVLCLINDNKPMQITIDQLLQFPLANAAAIPRHLAEA